MTAGGAAPTLSLHVLDTARGQAGAGLAFSLKLIEAGGARTLIADARTDPAGRWAAGDAVRLRPGVYEFLFEAGAYQSGFDAPNAAAGGFYDVIPIRFSMRENGHYHIPLILSPFGYSTYRGG